MSKSIVIKPIDIYDKNGFNDVASAINTDYLISQLLMNNTIQSFLTEIMYPMIIANPKKLNKQLKHINNNYIYGGQGFLHDLLNRVRDIFRSTPSYEENEYISPLSSKEIHKNTFRVGYDDITGDIIYEGPEEREEDIYKGFEEIEEPIKFKSKFNVFNHPGYKSTKYEFGKEEEGEEEEREEERGSPGIFTNIKDWFKSLIRRSPKETLEITEPRKKGLWDATNEEIDEFWEKVDVEALKSSTKTMDIGELAEEAGKFTYLQGKDIVMKKKKALLSFDNRVEDLADRSSSEDVSDELNDLIIKSEQVFPGLLSRNQRALQSVLEGDPNELLSDIDKYRKRFNAGIDKSKKFVNEETKDMSKIKKRKIITDINRTSKTIDSIYSSDTNIIPEVKFKTFSEYIKDPISFVSDLEEEAGRQKEVRQLREEYEVRSAMPKKLRGDEDRDIHEILDYNIKSINDSIADIENRFKGAPDIRKKKINKLNKKRNELLKMVDNYDNISMKDRGKALIEILSELTFIKDKLPDALILDDNEAEELMNEIREDPDQTYEVLLEYGNKLGKRKRQAVTNGVLLAYHQFRNSGNRNNALISDIIDIAESSKKKNNFELILEGMVESIEKARKQKKQATKPLAYRRMLKREANTKKRKFLDRFRLEETLESRAERKTRQYAQDSLTMQALRGQRNVEEKGREMERDVNTIKGVIKEDVKVKKLKKEKKGLQSKLALDEAELKRIQKGKSPELSSAESESSTESESTGTMSEPGSQSSSGQSTPRKSRSRSGIVIPELSDDDMNLLNREVAFLTTNNFTQSDFEEDFITVLPMMKTELEQQGTFNNVRRLFEKGMLRQDAYKDVQFGPGGPWTDPSWTENMQSVLWHELKSRRKRAEGKLTIGIKAPDGSDRRFFSPLMLMYLKHSRKYNFIP